MKISMHHRLSLISIHSRAVTNTVLTNPNLTRRQSTTNLTQTDQSENETTKTKIHAHAQEQVKKIIACSDKERERERFFYTSSEKRQSLFLVSESTWV